ncbi:MAG: dicarboxylate/amino acid:cation symporter [Pseudomonadota bacterium]
MVKPRFLHSRMTRRLDVLVKGKLWLQVIIALALGAGVGMVIGPDMALFNRDLALVIAEWLGLPGQMFLAIIRMVIIPLAASSIILGVAGSGGGEAMKQVGSRLILFITSTTLAATVIGVVLANLIRPGRNIDDPLPVTPRLKPPPAETMQPEGDALSAITRDLPELITSLIPQNITSSVLEQDMLAVVVFSLFIGIAAVNAHDRELTKPLISLAQAVLEVCMTVIRTAMRFAPIAVFGLIAETTAANGMQTLADLAVYCAVVLTGLAALLLLYLVIVTVFGRLSPIAFLKTVAPVQLLAFSTSSSAAVMPLTMKTAVEKLAVTPTLAGAVIPLASTVNMAGTALYQAVAIMFLAEIANVSLSLGDLALIMVTLTGASIGAPAAPGASIAILAATATNFGIPPTGMALIFGVDRILDMARTSVNVTGDLVACRLLSQPSGKENVETLQEAPA